MIELKDILQVAFSFVGTWLAIRVELRWLRADQKRTEATVADHSTRIRALEIGE